MESKLLTPESPQETTDELPQLNRFSSMNGLNHHGDVMYYKSKLGQESVENEERRRSRDFSESIEIVISYWTRTIASSQNALFYNFTDLILEYCRFTFRWDEQRKHKGWDLSVDGLIATHTEKCGSTRWITVYSDAVVSAEEFSTLRWEITLRREGDINQGRGGQETHDTTVAMGFVSADNIDQVDVEHDLRIGSQKSIGYALWVWDGSYSGFTWEGNNVEFRESGAYDCKVGDKWRLEIDFVERECVAFINDKFLGKMDTKIPQQIYLAASSLREGTCIETTLFEAR